MNIPALAGKVIIGIMLAKVALGATVIGGLALAALAASRDDDHE